MSADSRVVATVPAQTQTISAVAVVPALTVEMILHRRAVIRQAITEAMEENVHYGIIPGTGDRMSLLKEGAELLLSMFHVAVEPIVTDLSTETEVRFRVECRGSVNGEYVGSGVGICSSNEEKYRWRKPKTDAEFEDMLAKNPSSVKFKYFVSKSGKEFKDKVVRQSPYDTIQTVLSMADKRARVSLCKGALAASECLKGKKSNKWGDGNAARNERAPAKDPGFNQKDPGSTPSTQPKNQNPAPSNTGSAPKAATPPAEPAAPALIDEEAVERIGRILDNSGIPDSAFLGAFEIGTVGALEATRLEAAFAWLQRNSP